MIFGYNGNKFSHSTASEISSVACRKCFTLNHNHSNSIRIIWKRVKWGPLISTLFSTVAMTFAQSKFCFENCCKEVLYPLIYMLFYFIFFRLYFSSFILLLFGIFIYSAFQIRSHQNDNICQFLYGFVFEFIFFQFTRYNLRLLLQYVPPLNSICSVLFLCDFSSMLSRCV